MHLIMAGIDYKKADISLREQYSFTEHQTIERLEHIARQADYRAVIVSTCNRTELYFSTPHPWSIEKIAHVFASCTGLSIEGFYANCWVKEGNDVLSYIMELACGLHSMIPGEDQIITQLKQAVELARLHRAVDAKLNTLFRHAITCAKRVKSAGVVQMISPSIVSRMVDTMRNEGRCPKDKNILIIGNGEIGRLAASALLAEGAHVCMTLRHYKNKDVVVPHGCETVAYDARAAKMEWADYVVSATKSPHCTVTVETLANTRTLPTHFFDLAVPRDLDPKLAEVYGVQCYDVDRLSQGASALSLDALQKIHRHIEEQIEKFTQWVVYHEAERKAVIV